MIFFPDLNSNNSYLRTYIILGSVDRPNMNQVVSDLKECLATELAQWKKNGVTESSQIFTVQCDYRNQSICKIVLKLFQG